MTEMRISKITQTILLLSLLSYHGSVFAEESLLFNLKYKSAEKVTKEIKFYGNSIGTYVYSKDDRFSVFIDEKRLTLPKIIYRKLQGLRNSVSYDWATGGIEKIAAPAAVCEMEGSAEGLELEVLYITYDNNNRVIKSEKKPVYSQARNCLFHGRYKPVKASAKENARVLVEIVDMLNILYDTPPK